MRVRVAVVGVGPMGKWLAKFAKQNLGEVTVADKNIAKAERVAKELEVEFARMAEAASVADLILVAVPVSKTADVVESLSKSAQKGALLADISSVKSEVVERMRGIEGLELVSLHPLFGPGATSVKGKDIVAIPVKPGKRYTWLKNRLAELGARVVEMKAEDHDRTMAIVQCMTHFVLLAYLSALKSIKGVRRALGFRTPMFSSLFDSVKSVLAGNPLLYGELQVYNKYAKVMRSTLMEACRSLDIAFSAGDAKITKALFKSGLASWGREEAERAYRKLYERFEGRE